MVASPMITIEGVLILPLKLRNFSVFQFLHYKTCIFVIWIYKLIHTNFTLNIFVQIVKIKVWIISFFCLFFCSYFTRLQLMILNLLGVIFVPLRFENHGIQLSIWVHQVRLFHVLSAENCALGNVYIVHFKYNFK